MLSRWSFTALLLAQFVVAFGYGFFLPILPGLIRASLETTDTSIISRHSGLLTGVYTLALFIFSPLWGWLADRHGRRRILLLGLAGYAASLLIVAFSSGVNLLYGIRFVSGGFAAAVAPASYALVGDYARGAERARQFSYLTVANALGSLAGPMIGGLIAGAITIGPVSSIPFELLAGLVSVTLLIVAWTIPKVIRVYADAPLATSQTNKTAFWRLLVLSFVTGTTLGVFEVGTTLEGTQLLGLSAFSLGLMFSECMLVMLLAQTAVFSPLIEVHQTVRLLTPALAILALGLAAEPLAKGELALAATVAGVAASGGILVPVITYWVSLTGEGGLGGHLGADSAAVNLGQAIGSAAAGLLFGASLVPNAPFTLTAVLALVGLIVSIRLPGMLIQPQNQQLRMRTPSP